ncbi:hypothetical protein AMECASPLE_023497 [Ameca splendens]|uniref:Uncharacterized protein n=1 Tax=Ameca splendens TaxID=208324 RepID=A0ABV0Z249_9TELE
MFMVVVLLESEPPAQSEVFFSFKQDSSDFHYAKPIFMPTPDTTCSKFLFKLKSFHLPSCFCLPVCILIPVHQPEKISDSPTRAVDPCHNFKVIKDLLVVSLIKALSYYLFG